MAKYLEKYLAICPSTYFFYFELCDKDNREESSCVPSKPVQDEVRHVVCRGWPPIATCISCNMGMRDLPDMYARSLRAAGPRAEGIHIRKILSAHVTTDI